MSIISERKLETTATITKHKKREGSGREKLVPYSLRHLAITNMTLSGVSLSDIAFMCGTSVKQIEHTYYQLLEEKMRQVAKARFIRKDGQIIPSSIVGE